VSGEKAGTYDCAKKNEHPADLISGELIDSKAIKSHRLSNPWHSYVYSFYGFGLILGELDHASGILANGLPHQVFSVAQTNHKGHIGKQALNRSTHWAGQSELPTSMPIYFRYFNSVNPQLWKALTCLTVGITPNCREWLPADLQHPALATRSTRSCPWTPTDDPHQGTA
jgi:hypothetical protein